MPARASITSLRELEQTRQRLRQVNVVLTAMLALFVPLLAWDLFQSTLAARGPLQPISPNFRDLEKPAVSIPSLNLSGSLLTPSVSSQAKKLEGWMDDLPQIRWKVKGILSGASKRALLEDPEQKQQLWVTEGQQVGPSKVVRIDEKSVTLETAGETRELRL